MRLEGIHHITAITGDAPRNVDFYTRVLGLRLTAKSVNQDDPGVYHLFYGDEHAQPGADLTFFEYPGAKPGRPGAGMVHRIVHRVGSEDAIAFWADRLAAEGVPTTREGATIRFADPEGLEHELIVDGSGEEPLVAQHPEIPTEHALRGFAGVRAYSGDPDRSNEFLEALGFEPGWVARGDSRTGRYEYDQAPPGAGVPGAGTVHHVAWASQPEEHAAWRERAAAAGARPTPIIERFYFKSIYFREPSGVLFEIATIGPGFTADEPLESLGERLSLPPDFEGIREQVEPMLTPIRNPRESWSRT